MNAGAIDTSSVHDFLTDLQDRICAGLERVNGQAKFLARELENERGGTARPRVLSDGPVIERAAVNFSHSHGAALPPAATERRPELAGCPFEAVSLSLIVHPRNPYAPTTHANFRFFHARATEPAWWFGGGFDLTPYYGFVEDARHWHEQARDAVEPHGRGLYARFKRNCDEYFFLPHRDEARGIGGLFVDDYAEGTFDEAFALTRSMGEHFLPAYLPILERRKDTPYGDRERDFQKLRRGRYVEFNLIYDRGTRFGLQASRRTESILASLPPEVSWRYDWTPEPGSEEARLYEEFLPVRDWLDGA